MNRNGSESKQNHDKNTNYCDESFYDQNSEILHYPNKIGSILIKYISHDLKDVTWEKEGIEVISLLINLNIKK